MAFISTVLTCSAILQGTIDVKRLQGILEEGLRSKDLSSVYYSVKGLKQINAKIPDICQVLYDIKAHTLLFVQYTFS